jgi:lipopolysaccharide export system permease protein
MQFLWRQVEDLVGKGIDTLVLGELFMYAALNLIPMSLPLAILLASLMTFGGMGERLELLAIKAAGVSLLKAMKPLIIVMVFISIGSFFFQNEAMPRINVKLRALLISIKQKSPELDIPEGAFYTGIDKYSIYVNKKDPKTKMLRGVMIYDTSDGFDNLSVFVCDSAKMQGATNKKFLLLSLYDGQRFSNFRQADMNDQAQFSRQNNQFVPYSRENFKTKKIIISFDANFNRMDEAAFDGTQISKSMSQIGSDLDSMRIDLDSLNKQDRVTMSRHYFAYRQESVGNLESVKDSKDTIPVVSKKEMSIARISFDSIMNSLKEAEKTRIYDNAVSATETNSSSFMFQSYSKASLQKNIRYHEVERQSRFAYAFACLVFFFVGAPLGAIIRKGGLGMPVVVSVVFFIIYYMINNVGLKMARDGGLEVWQGVWMSSFVLFPIGIFLTYKAINDSALFNVEAYGKFFRRLLHIEQKVDDSERGIEIDKIPATSQLNVDTATITNMEALPNDKLKDVVQNYTQYGYDYNTMLAVLNILKDRGDDLIDIRIDSRDYSLAEKLFMNFKKSSLIANILYLITLILLVLKFVIVAGAIKWTLIAVAIVYFIFYIRSMIYSSDFERSLKIKPDRMEVLMRTLGFLWYPFSYFRLAKKMKNEMKGAK